MSSVRKRETAVLSLAVAPIADCIGCKYIMSVCLVEQFFIIGVIVPMASESSWVQVALGAGAGVSALSTTVPHVKH